MEVPAAFLVLRPGAVFSEESLRRFCHERMPAYQVPVRFTTLEALPRNEAAKLLRSQLAARSTGGKS